MNAPLVVNTTDGTCWTRRSVTRGGIALYALEGVCSCPEFVMATLPELEEHGIAGTADVLPVPVGPQMPDFPPPPRTELEKLRAERARLQGLLAEAVRDAHLARRERDLIRERVSEPFGCKHCGEVKRSHGRRYIGGAGMHSWERPSDEQVKDRMLARRAARFPSSGERLAQLLVARTEDLLTAEARIAELEAQREADHKTWQHDLSTARSEREAMAARIAELEAEPLAWAWKLDAKSLDNFLIALGSFSEHEPMDEAVDRIHELLRSYREATSVDGITWRIAPTQALREDEPLIVDADGAEPTLLRWGLNDVMWGDDDTVTVLLSDADGRPFWLELEDTQATVLRDDLAGPDGPAAWRAAWDTEQCGPLYSREEAARAHCEHDARIDYPDGTRFTWRAYEETVAELVVNGQETPTGYTVTRIPLASEHDKEADE